MLNKIRTFVTANLVNLSPNARLVLPANLPARDRAFLTGLCDELNLVATYDEFDEAGSALITISFDDAMLQLALAEQEEAEEASEEEEPEWKDAINRVFNKFDKAVITDVVEESYETQLESKMGLWKREYYREKLEFEFSDEVALHDLAYRYIEGLQWVLHYYYSGVASWGWFYNYHYAPKISGTLSLALHLLVAASLTSKSRLETRRILQVRLQPWHAVPSVRAAHGSFTRSLIITHPHRVP